MYRRNEATTATKENHGAKMIRTGYTIDQEVSVAMDPPVEQRYGEFW